MSLFRTRLLLQLRDPGSVQEQPRPCGEHRLRLSSGGFTSDNSSSKGLFLCPRSLHRCPYIRYQELFQIGSEQINIAFLLIFKSFPGATSTTPVVLAAGEGRQFTSPGFDGVSNYAAETKCLWTFAPAAGATLSFSCSAFSITSTAPVGERCAGNSFLLDDITSFSFPFLR